MIKYKYAIILTLLVLKALVRIMIDQVASYQTAGLSILDVTCDLLSGLTDDELNAVQTVARAFIVNNHDYKLASGSGSDDTVVPFQAQSEAQLLERIDHSLSQIKEGNYRDSEEVEDELLAGIDE